MPTLETTKYRNSHDGCFVQCVTPNNLILFGLAVGITAVLVVLERFVLWLLARHNER